MSTTQRKMTDLEQYHIEIIRQRLDAVAEHLEKIQWHVGITGKKDRLCVNDWRKVELETQCLASQMAELTGNTSAGKAVAQLRDCYAHDLVSAGQVAIDRPQFDGAHDGDKESAG